MNFPFFFNFESAELLTLQFSSGVFKEKLNLRHANKLVCNENQPLDRNTITFSILRN